MELDLEGKRALVTGSTSGIGEGIALAFAAEGASVVINGRDADRAAAVVAKVTAAGGRAAIALGDLSTDEGADGVARRALDAFGGIDILVNNAGGRSGDAGATDWTLAKPSDWMDTYSKNTVAALRLCQLLAPQMQERKWGRLIQIASVSASSPVSVIHYAATKAGMVNMTLGLSKALSQTGVTSNAISPGLIITPAAERWFAAIAREKGWGDDRAKAEAHVITNLVRQTVGRLGTPKDIGDIAVFLASTRADFINGANIRVDGGSSPSVA
jgi:3-oxoacyl-[acyl-carrier protein] reductase